MFRNPSYYYVRQRISLQNPDYMDLYCQNQVQDHPQLQVYRNIYLRNGLEPEKNILLKKTGQLAGIIGMTVAGCAMEGFVNPLILTGLLKYF